MENLALGLGRFPRILRLSLGRSLKAPKRFSEGKPETHLVCSSHTGKALRRSVIGQKLALFRHWLNFGVILSLVKIWRCSVIGQNLTTIVESAATGVNMKSRTTAKLGFKQILPARLSLNSGLDEFHILRR